MAMSVVFQLIKGLKGEKKKAQFKAVFLKLYQQIGAAYADDEDFQR